MTHGVFGSDQGIHNEGSRNSQGDFGGRCE